MRLVQIRALKDEDADCLMRELSVYSPTCQRQTVLIELEEQSNTHLLALLSAIEACVAANEIRSVQLELDGDRYTLAPR
jgi:hypothetical protein